MNQPAYLHRIDEYATEDTAAMFRRFSDRVGSLVPDDVIEWIESAIVMEDTKAGAESGTIKLEPWQIEPVLAQFERGVRMVCISGPEQYGKSFIWKAAMAYVMRFITGLFYIIYEEKEKAKAINDEEFHPIVQAVEELARQLKTKEGKYTQNSYAMRDNILKFMGAGADITSRMVKRAVTDECDTYPLTYDKIIAQIENVIKRLRRATGRGESMLTMCSSFKGTDDSSPMWHYIKDTSLATFTLRCMNCGDLTIPSTMIDGKRDPFTKKFHGGLKWKSENFIVDPDSLSLQCPVCKYEHSQDESFDMVSMGEYIHKNPLNYSKKGFIFGSLCSYYDPSDKKWLALSWLDIAQARVNAGHSHNFEIVRTYWNSFVGLPVPKKTIMEDQEAAIKAHCHTTDDSKILAVVGSADTQESPWGWFWIIRGIDENWNTYLIDCGFASSKAQLSEVIKDTYLGMPVTLFIIDQGGTNATDVKALAKTHRQVWQYKGASKPSNMWKISRSDGQTKLLLCDAGRLQIMILRLIYEPADRDNNYWNLPDMERMLEMSNAAETEAEAHTHKAEVFDYVAHMASVRPLENVKDGDQYQKWNCGTHDRRDFFDCEKMALVLLGREQFRKKLTRAMEDRKKSKEIKPKQDKRRRKRKENKPAGWIGKARQDGKWIP